MKSPIPMLAVTDIAASMRFYTDVLGFQITFALPPDSATPDHVSLQQGDTTIMLHPLRVEDEAGRDHLGAGVVLYLSLADDEEIDAYFDRVKAAGARVLQEPTDQFWGDRDWGVADPDGYQLYIAKTVRSVSPEEMLAQTLSPAMAD